MLVFYSTTKHSLFFHQRRWSKVLIWKHFLDDSKIFYSFLQLYSQFVDLYAKIYETLGLLFFFFCHLLLKLMPIATHEPKKQTYRYQPAASPIFTH